MKFYYLELMLSSGAKVIIWSKYYHKELNVIIWDEMLLSGANVIIELRLLSGANVIIWS
jgi:hypothetical protein